VISGLGDVPQPRNLRHSPGATRLRPGASSHPGDHVAYHWLTPPSRAVFFLSVLLAVLALLVRYAHVAIPVVSNYSFETLLIAFLLLLAGNMFRGF
jgi:hypothetical protein